MAYVDTDDVKDEEKNSGTFSHKGEVNKTLEMVNDNANYDLSGYLSGLTDDEKKDMQEAVRVYLKMEQIVKPDDAADALAAAITHALMTRIAYR